MMQAAESTPPSRTSWRQLPISIREVTKSPPVCTMALGLSAGVLALVIVVCIPIAVMQGVMRWPIFHPSMAFTAPPEQYFAGALLPLSGAFWFLYAFAFARGVSSLLRGRVVKMVNIIAGIWGFFACVSLAGVGAVPVLQREAVHDAFAKICFGSTAIQCCLYCYLDTQLSSMIKVSTKLRRGLAAMMVLSAVEVVVGIMISRRHNLGNWFGLVAGGEWVFVFCMFAFIVSSIPCGRFIDHDRPLYSSLAQPMKGGTSMQVTLSAATTTPTRSVVSEPSFNIVTV